MAGEDEMAYDERAEELTLVRYYAEYSKWLAGISLVLLGGTGIAFSDVGSGWIRYVLLGTLVLFLGSVVCSAVALLYPPTVEIAQLKFPDDFEKNKLPFDPATEMLKRFMRAFGFQVLFFVIGLIGFVAVVFGEVFTEPAKSDTSTVFMPQEGGRDKQDSPADTA